MKNPTRCALCGLDHYVLIDDVCGECLLVTNGSWGSAPEPEHEPMVAADGSSPKYLAGWGDAARHLYLIGRSLDRAREARRQAREASPC
jgi:hypothetical protein